MHIKKIDSLLTKTAMENLENKALFRPREKIRTPQEISVNDLARVRILFYKSGNIYR